MGDSYWDPRAVALRRIEKHRRDLGLPATKRGRERAEEKLRARGMLSKGKKGSG
jgi:hypothetical protein